MKNISKEHYKYCLKFYLITYICLTLFILVLPVIDSSFWVIFGFIDLIIVAILLGPIIISCIYLVKSKKAINGDLMIGKIIGYESTFSLLPMPRMALQIKLDDGNIVVSGGILKKIDVEKYKGKEIQISRYKKGIYCLMIV